MEQGDCHCIARKGYSYHLGFFSILDTGKATLVPKDVVTISLKKYWSPALRIQFLSPICRQLTWTAHNKYVNTVALQQYFVTSK